MDINITIQRIVDFLYQNSETVLNEKEPTGGKLVIFFLGLLNLYQWFPNYKFQPLKYTMVWRSFQNHSHEFNLMVTFFVCLVMYFLIWGRTSAGH